MLAIATLLAALALAAAENTNKNPHFVPGHDTIVHLFEWKWNDIARECEQFLGPMGYGGVQVRDRTISQFLANHFDNVSFHLTHQHSNCTLDSYTNRLIRFFLLFLFNLFITFD